MNTKIEIPAIEPLSGDKLRKLARWHKIPMHAGESDEDIRERTIRILNRRKDDAKYKKIKGYINLSLMHVAGGGGFEFEIRQ